VIARVPRLRYPLPDDLATHLLGQPLRDILRRGKYLLLAFDKGHLLLHLGMSGSLRVLLASCAPVALQKHDHFDLVFEGATLRLRDPRRFGAVLWLPASTTANGLNLDAHPLLANLGIEPLSAEFTPAWLYAATRNRAVAIKPLLMDSHLIVGVGNIYASESLFRAGIDPRTPACRISLRRYVRLVEAIRTTLETAIAAGGSSLRDFTHADGSPGYFQQQYFVYGREGEACRICNQPIRSLRQAQRATFYCGRCQRR
ncbi:MAG: bifunctional DNA-formamidopyrimidine glycosylase/DNA-(apurinic or apyrimidinic site) lyase, partial [Sterolibacterium sp.]|nr:bifunctional DNA-formamidopyrimidine glycosylase/DNA-(apurinic or apyrimidinic site) lyase [Sterolibacterium sp.]